MKADPDFHPIASAWLAGTAMPPEQRLLSEILHTDGNVEEYAALCRTEALLQQAGRTAAERRKSLAAILSGKPWPQRAVSFLKSRTIRWAAAAAAAVLAIGAWALWPSAAPEESQMAKQKRVPQFEARPVANAQDADALRVVETPLPEEAALETKLRQWYVGEFSAVGPLPEAVAKLLAELEGSIHVTAQVQEAGDAPVFLKPPLAMPAWSLLQIMALQSGTEVRLSGKTLVFRAARKPVPLAGSLTRTTSLSALRVFSPLGDEDDHSAELTANGVAAAFGSGLEFRFASETSASYSGSSRGVRVLEQALKSVTNPPLNAEIGRASCRERVW